MKHILTTSSLLAAALCMTVRAAEPDSANNIVINGDMESWEPVKPNPTPRRPPAKFPEDLSPEGFDAVAEIINDDFSVPVGVSIAPDRLHKHGGDCSARIQNTEPEQSGYLSLREIPVEPNTQYLVRMWIKGEDIMVDSDPKHGVVVWLKYGPANDFWKSPLTATELHIPDIREGTFEWEKFEFPLNTPEGIDLLRVTLTLRRATGTVWFDDLEVIPVGQAKPVSNF